MTGDQYVNLVLKRLLGVGSFRDEVLEYLRKQVTDLYTRVYNKDGTYGETKAE